MVKIRNYNYKPRLGRQYLVKLTITHQYGPPKEVILRVSAASPLKAEAEAKKIIETTWNKIKTVQVNAVRDADNGKTY